MTDAPAPHAWEPLPERVRIGLFRFAYGMQEMSTAVDWLLTASHVLAAHPRVGDVATEAIADTPVDMSRNRALVRARELGLHFALFLDNDMWPDYRLKRGQPADDGNLPFLPHALDFALAHDGPCLVGAPYCCMPPDEEVLVMKWAEKAGDEPDPQAYLQKFGRDEVYGKAGFGRVAALATGVLLIDLRCLGAWPADEPWFRYQYTTGENAYKSSSEDVVFTRDMALLGVPNYCFWSAWAGHWKLKLVQKPQPLEFGQVPRAFKKSVVMEINRLQQAKGA